ASPSLDPSPTIRALLPAGILPAGGPAGAAVLVTGTMRIIVTWHDLSSGVPESLKNQLAAARGSGTALVSLFHVAGRTPEIDHAVDAAVQAGAAVVAVDGGPAGTERRVKTAVGWGVRESPLKVSVSVLGAE